MALTEKQALALISKGESVTSILKRESVEVHVDIGRGIVVKAIPSIDEETGNVKISGVVENDGRAPVTVTIECPPETAEEYIRDAVKLNLPEKALAFISARGGRRPYFARRILSSKSAPKEIGVGKKG